MSGYPTSRRHPRSMAEAWPREHADPIEHYRHHTTGLWWAVACVLGCIAIGWLAAQGV